MCTCFAPSCNHLGIGVFVWLFVLRSVATTGPMDEFASSDARSTNGDVLTHVVPGDAGLVSARERGWSLPQVDLEPCVPARPAVSAYQNGRSTMRPPLIMCFLVKRIASLFLRRHLGVGLCVVCVVHTHASGEAGETE